MLELFVILAVLGVAVAGWVWSGYVVSIMWGWFLVPMGAPQLGVAMAVGLAALVGMLTHQYRKRPKEEVWSSVGDAFLRPLVVLGIGWVAKQFL